MRVRELAEWLGATYEGDGEKELTGVAALETAGAGDVSFVGSRKAARQAEVSAAGCLIVPADFSGPSYRTVIRVAEPRTAFARVMNRFYPTAELKPGVHSTAVIGMNVQVGAMVAVGPHASIGDSSRIGVSTSIGAGCAIGKRVNIGEGCTLHANVTIYDNVEIGGNSCGDRAAIGVTCIGEGAKLDNMVHVAHNCRIGRHVVVAAQTGFSGGVVVEDYAVVGGQVGVGDKARIESRAVIGSGAGILSSKIVRGGQVVWGTPARPLKEHLEQLANLARLPETRQEVAELKRRVAELESKT